MKRINSKKLEANLKEIGAIPKFSKKDDIKGKLIKKLVAEETSHLEIVYSIHQAKENLKAPARVKNRVLSKINVAKPFERIVWFFTNPQKSIAGLTLGTVLCSIIFSFTFNPSPIYASKKTILEINQGSVVIKRKGQLLTESERAILEVGDIISTEPDSKATIYFPDETVSRLSAKSEVEIKEVAINPQNPKEDSVEIEVTKGRVWNTVANKQDEQGTFNVTTPVSTTKAVKKATFDVAVEQNEVEINTIQNSVTVTLKNQASVEVEEGEKAEINKVQLVKSAADKKEVQDEWITENIDKDNKLIAALNEQSNENIESAEDNSENVTEEKNTEEVTTILLADTTKQETESTNKEEVIITVSSDNSDTDQSEKFDEEIISAKTNAELLKEMEAQPSPIAQSPASPNTTVQKSRKAILDLYYEQIAK